MNSLFHRLSCRFRKNKVRNLAISIVILVEILILAVVGSFAWVETVSSIKIASDAGSERIVDTYVFTEAMIGSKSGTIDMGKYFNQGGDMHFAPCSSADGWTFYFPKANMSSGYNVYRKGNFSDRNTSYLSVSFRLKADINADFFFDQVPTVSDDIRVSVTSKSEGSTTPAVTTIYANSASTTPVVSATNGASSATTVKPFSNHIKGKGSANRLFAVGANETKIVTINVWLQKKSGSIAAAQIPTDNSDLTSNMSTTLTLTNLGITSSLTPRHVTLLPTPEWDRSGETQYFYAWCWMTDGSVASRLYKLEKDANEHYSFDYNGKYDNALFIRAKKDTLTTENMPDRWNTTYIHNRTDDTAIPDDPVDPTYIITNITGGDPETIYSGTKSTGQWVEPSTIKVAHVNDQTDSWGTMEATSYVGTNTTSSHKIESTDPSSTKHKDTVHAWPTKKVKLKATPAVVDGNAMYAFAGWYDDAAMTHSPLSVSATYEIEAPASGSEVTYYAKFKEVRKITLKQYVEGVNSNAAATTALAATTGVSASGNHTSRSFIVDKGDTVTLSETLTDTGYSLEGFFSVQTAGTALTPVTTVGSTKSVTVTANSANYNTTYYVRFTANSYNVTTHAYYTTNGGTSYTADDATGGTVQTGTTAAAGATSVDSVKYKTTVALTAAPGSDYIFEGWFTGATGSGHVSGSYTSTSYTYTLNTAGNVDIYGRFKKNKFNVTANAVYKASGAATYTAGATGGSVNAGGTGAGATSTVKATVSGSTVSLVASPASNYVFEGWYTGANDGTLLDSGANYSYPLTTYSNVNVYARFRYSLYKVTAHARHSTNNGSSYSNSDTTTGGQVKVGTSTKGASSYANVNKGSAVTLLAEPADGYEFDGWYNAATGGALIDSSATTESYSYTLDAFADQNVYARFVKVTWEIGSGTSGENDWTWTTATLSSGNVTASKTLTTEGQDFSFKFRKHRDGSATYTYYGGGESYENITSTSFISNLTMSSPGSDTYMKGHKGTYSYTFNLSTNKLNVTASYSNITLKLYDNTDVEWLKNDSAKLYYKTDKGTSSEMSRNGNTWSVSVPSNYSTNSKILRKSSDGSVTHNTWNCPDRGYITECKITAAGDSNFTWRNW